MKIMKWNAVCLLLSLATPLFADEGMWLFDRFPRDTVKQKYGMDASPEFLDNFAVGLSPHRGGHRRVRFAERAVVDQSASSLGLLGEA